MKTFILGFLLMTTINSQLSAQYYKQDGTYKKFFVGSTLFMLMNIPPKERPDFAQLNFGYRLTGKDVVSIEFKTWRYFQPLGIQYGKNYTDANEKFPGYIREFGFALVYQRFIWKGFYAGIHVMSAWQTFVDLQEEKVDNGFQIFNTYRLGYHFKFFKDRFFIEPSLAVTHRPFHTEMPNSFKQMDDKWIKLFFAEPGFHFGINF